MIVRDYSNSRNVTARHLAAQQEPEAYRLGQRDARDGEYCLPELYFVRRAQVEAYARGHESVRGETLLSSQILRQVSA